MYKDRLEEIKDKWDYAYESEKDGSYLSIEDIEFLIEQAERVKELEETVEDYKAVNKELHQRGRKVRKQNKRYREALEWIKDLSEHNEYEDTLNQILLKAVEALEGEINDSERIDKRTREI